MSLVLFFIANSSIAQLTSLVAILFRSIVESASEHISGENKLLELHWPLCWWFCCLCASNSSVNNGISSWKIPKQTHYMLIDFAPIDTMDSFAQILTQHNRHSRNRRKEYCRSSKSKIKSTTLWSGISTTCVFSNNSPIIVSASRSKSTICRLMRTFSMFEKYLKCRTNNPISAVKNLICQSQMRRKKNERYQ